MNDALRASEKDGFIQAFNMVAKAPGSYPLQEYINLLNEYDRFWFTFFHEAGHILNHGKKDIFLEDIEYSNLDLEKEKEADEFAVEWTLSNEEEREVRDALPLGKDEIKYFAKKFNTHPAIIIGRLHKKGLLPYSKGREFIVKLDF